MVLVLVLLPALAESASSRRPRRSRAIALAPAIALTHREGRGLRRRDAGRRASAPFPGCCTMSRTPDRASCSASRCSRSRSASPTARRCCSASRSRSAPSLPACHERIRAQPERDARSLCRCAMHSRCCSSSPSACCSSPRSSCASRCRCSRPCSSSCSASRSPPIAIVRAFGHPTAHGADDFREPRPDRRVLVHPRRARRGLQCCPTRGATSSSRAPSFRSCSIPRVFEAIDWLRPLFSRKTVAHRRRQTALLEPARWRRH